MAYFGMFESKNSSSSRLVVFIKRMMLPCDCNTAVEDGARRARGKQKVWLTAKFCLAVDSILVSSFNRVATIFPSTKLLGDCCLAWEEEGVS